MAIVLPPLQYLLLAVAIGIIVGLENEYRMYQGAKIYLGLRTSIFLSLLGYFFAVLYFVTSDTLTLLAGIGTITVYATAVYISKTALTKNPGATTYTSTFLLFFAGLIAGLGHYEYAVILAVLLAAISFYKREFLDVIAHIKRKELIAVLNILLIAFVILPLLPDSFIGPYQFFNPFEFWFIVSTIAAVFFLQYIVLRFSKYGLLLSSMIGSVITGTAVTFALVKLAANIKTSSKAIFYNVMFSANLPMILVQATLFTYVTTLSTSILFYLLPVLIVSLASMGVLAYLGRKDINTAVKAPTSPFPMGQILQFAAIFFVIFTVSRVVDIFAPQFLTLTLFVSSLANVAGSALSLGLIFLNDSISPQYAAFLLGLIISASVLEKAFIGLLSKKADLRRGLFKYSLVLGFIILATAFISYYGI